MPRNPKGPQRFVYVFGASDEQWSEIGERLRPRGDGRIWVRIERREQAELFTLQDIDEVKVVGDFDEHLLETITV